MNLLRTKQNQINFSFNENCKFGSKIASSNKFELAKNHIDFLNNYKQTRSFSKAALACCFDNGKNTTGYYVYFLIDPTSDEIFYVGKGKGSRVSKHEINAQNGKIDNPFKFARIKQIHNSGQKVLHIILDSNLSESYAYFVEKAFILHLRDFGITNIAGGIESSFSASIKKAQSLKELLQPFDVWMNNAETWQIDEVSRLYGSPEVWYNKFSEDLNKLANHVNPKTRAVCTSNSIRNEPVGCLSRGLQRA